MALLQQRCDRSEAERDELANQLAEQLGAAANAAANAAKSAAEAATSAAAAAFTATVSADSSNADAPLAVEAPDPSPSPTLLRLYSATRAVPELCPDSPPVPPPRPSLERARRRQLWRSVGVFAVVTLLSSLAAPSIVASSLLAADVPRARQPRASGRWRFKPEWRSGPSQKALEWKDTLGL